MKERLLTTREASLILHVPEQEVIDLANSGAIASFKVGGEFLRFRKEDLLAAKNKIKSRPGFSYAKNSRLEKLREFFYFNDFYLASSVIIIILLWVILKTVFL